MEKKFISAIAVDNTVKHFLFTNSQQDYYDVSIIDDMAVPQFRMFKDPSGQFKIQADNRIPENIYNAEIELNDAINENINTFQDFSIRFTSNGRIIEGLLTGTDEHWNFTSADHYFLQLYPNGRISPLTLHINDISHEQQDIHDTISQHISKIIS